ncbi:MAG TPA: hypothetical protein VME66_09890, partial [Candidatus Acidoferrales bacterium]|nr:hypothetical protein [Candidatus Acidoferrales bacterium]
MQEWYTRIEGGFWGVGNYWSESDDSDADAGERNEPKIDMGAANESSVDGERIGHASSRDEKKRAERWTEIDVYREADGQYLVRQVGRSTISGEHDIVRAYKIGDGAAACGALEKNGYITEVAAAALRQAAERDARFAAALGDRLDVADLAGGLLPGEPVVIVARNRDRALRFSGRLLARVSSRVADATRWQEIEIYAVSDGERYIVTSRAWESVGTPPVARAGSVFVVRTGIEAMQVLSRKSAGWLPAAAFDALREAAQRDPKFGAPDLLEQLETGSFKDTVGRRPALKATGRDSRRIVLEQMERGHRLLIAREGPPRPVWAGEGPPNVKPPATQVFLALSRERLVRKVRH